MNNSRASFVLDADLLTLRSFLAIIDLGSFSAAAKQVGRTQSAVSLQIGRLEERMQVSLFERTGRKVTATPEGEMFASYARKIIDLSDEGFAAVSAVETTEPLRIGITDHIQPHHLQRLLTGIRKALPKNKIVLTLGLGQDLHQRLDGNELDLIVTGPVADGGMELFKEPILWVRAGDYVPANPAVIDIVQMTSPCCYRQIAIDALNSLGLTWNEKVCVNSIDGIRSAVAAGFGISAIPRSAVGDCLEVITDGMPALPNTSINLYWNTSHPHPLTKACGSVIEKELKRIMLCGVFEDES